MPLIPELLWQRETDLYVRAQPGLQIEFHDSQDKTMKEPMKNTENLWRCNWARVPYSSFKKQQKFVIWAHGYGFVIKFSSIICELRFVSAVSRNGDTRVHSLKLCKWSRDCLPNPKSWSWQNHGISVKGWREPGLEREGSCSQPSWKELEIWGTLKSDMEMQSWVCRALLQ